MVIDILNDMDSDELFDNSPLEDIHSTEESRQVAQIIKTTFFNIIDGRDTYWPHLYEPFQLLATSGTTPTHMTIPLDTMDIEYVKYNVRTTTDTRDRFTTIKYIDPKEFMDILDSRDSSDSKVTQVTDPTGVFINVYNERSPQYWTSLDDSVIIFDAYDSVVDTVSMLAVKTQCRGKVYPTVTETDDFVFDLPVDAFSFLLAEAKSVSFLILKQAANPKAEAQSNTQRRRLSAEAGKVNKDIHYPDYGRRGKR